MPGAGEEDLAHINALAKSPLTAEQVYTFAVRLCDNEVGSTGSDLTGRRWRSWQSCSRASAASSITVDGKGPNRPAF